LTRSVKSPFQIGQTVSGTYLGQAFTGHLKQVTALQDGAYHRLTLRFDTAVDVVASPLMSNFRQQVTATVDHRGVTAEVTSDGNPHLVLKM